MFTPRIAIPAPKADAAYCAKTWPQYAAGVERAGGTAVEVPLTLSNSEIAQIIKSCDGVLLPGSPADVDPQKYDAAPAPETAAADPMRENVDELVLQDAFNMRKPILGICFGTQMLNVWAQGTLVQHIVSPVKHSRRDDEPEGTHVPHTVRIAPASVLAEIVAPALGKSPAEPIELVTNSSHHQAVETAGDKLQVSARAEGDDVVECVESTDPAHFVLGVQWHPERMFKNDAPSLAIFEALVTAARAWHEQARKDFETVVDI